MIQSIQRVFGTVALVSGNRKLDILKQRDSPELREVLDYCYNPYKTFGIKTKFKSEVVTLAGAECSPGSNDIPWEELKQLLDSLASREYTGHRAVAAVRAILAGAHPEAQFLVHCLLNKDLKIGIGVESINKAFPGLIPEFKVSLAETYSEKKARWPMIGQEKFDGKRSPTIIRSADVSLYSRNGILETKYQHIRDQFSFLANRLGPYNHFFDGELMFGMFGKRNEADTILKIYDYLPLDVWESRCDWLGQLKRVNYLQEMWTRVGMENIPNLELTATRLLRNYDEALEFYNEVVSRGGEGIMLKDANSQYVFDRGFHWLKMKPVRDIDLTIVGWFEGEGRLEGSLGGIIVNHNGVMVRVGSGFSDSLRDELWSKRDELEGITAELRFTEETPDGSLRFPRFVKLRTDK